jgi:hypothetical protein
MSKFSLDSLKHHYWMLPMVVFFTQLKGEDLDWYKEVEEEEIQRILQKFFHFVSVVELEGLLSKQEWDLFCDYHTELQYNIHDYEWYCRVGFEEEELDIPRLCKLMTKLAHILI